MKIDLTKSRKKIFSSEKFDKKVFVGKKDSKDNVFFLVENKVE